MKSRNWILQSRSIHQTVFWNDQIIMSVICDKNSWHDNVLKYTYRKALMDSKKDWLSKIYKECKKRNFSIVRTITFWRLVNFGKDMMVVETYTFHWTWLNNKVPPVVEELATPTSLKSTGFKNVKKLKSHPYRLFNRHYWE